jgi:hypothetical protein
MHIRTGKHVQRHREADTEIHTHVCTLLTENTGLIEFHTHVESSLTTELQEDGARLLDIQNARHILCRHGQIVHLGRRRRRKMREGWRRVQEFKSSRVQEREFMNLSVHLRGEKKKQAKT